LGFISEGGDGRLLGAVLQRLLSGDARGFGYVDDNTPELGIAVCPEHRGNGIGEWLIKAILEENIRRSYPAVSLSVRTDNPAIRLYERLGFAMVEDSETTNRAAPLS
jgi:ribosomal protein S18 acetylase RimI-like enzyme